MTLLRPSFEECPPALYYQNKALHWIGTKVKHIRIQPSIHYLNPNSTINYRPLWISIGIGVNLRILELWSPWKCLFKLYFLVRS